MRFLISVVSCCWKVIIWPRYVVHSSLVNISTLMSSISILSWCSSFGCWVFVIPGCILSSTFSVPRLKSHNIFWSCSFEEANKSTSSANLKFVRQFMIVVSQAHTHSSFLLPTWNVFFQGFLQNNVEEQARQRVTVFGSFLDLEHVTFFVCQYCGFLVVVQFSQEVGVFMLVRQDLRASQITFWYPTRGFFDQSSCTSLDGLLFGKTFWTPLDLLLGIGQVWDIVCCTVLSLTVYTAQAENISGGSYTTFSTFFLVYHFYFHFLPCFRRELVLLYDFVENLSHHFSSLIVARFDVFGSDSVAVWWFAFFESVDCSL